MKHKHYEKIVAKAANMDLVVFCKFKGSEWVESRVEWHDSFNFLDEYEYFLCLPQHKDACLHWLNGANAEENYLGKWNSIEPHSWHDQSVFNFDDGYTIRIKPSKEKRWIVTNGKKVKFIDAGLIYPEDWQLIEIEVEI